MQSLLPHSHDGDFGPITDDEVRDFQRTRGLPVTGIVDDATWNALETDAPPVLPAMPSRDVAAVMLIASMSEIAGYAWADRGIAPPGYMQGMALSFAQSYLRLKDEDRAVVEMQKAKRTTTTSMRFVVVQLDFYALGMSNESDGPHTLRHLYVLLLGLGMRESSGQHCWRP